MERSVKIVNGCKSLTIFVKSSVLDVWLSSGCASGVFSSAPSYADKQPSSSALHYNMPVILLYFMLTNIHSIQNKI